MTKKATPAPKVKVSYASCTIFTNTGPVTCPLCGVDVPASTVHTCSKKEC